MENFFKLAPKVRAYVSVVVLLGATTVLYSLQTLYSSPIGDQWLILAGLTLLTSLRPLPNLDSLSSISASMSARS